MFDPLGDGVNHRQRRQQAANRRDRGCLGPWAPRPWDVRMNPTTVTAKPSETNVANAIHRELAIGGFRMGIAFPYVGSKCPSP